MFLSSNNMSDTTTYDYNNYDYDYDNDNILASKANTNLSRRSNYCCTNIKIFTYHTTISNFNNSATTTTCSIQWSFYSSSSIQTSLPVPIQIHGLRTQHYYLPTITPQRSVGNLHRRCRKLTWIALHQLLISLGNYQH